MLCGSPGTWRAAFGTGVLFLIFWTCQASADIYRYVDERGVVHFTNTPSRPGFKLYYREAPRQRTLLVPPRRSSHGSLVRAAARRYGVDENLVKAVIVVESDSDPTAVSSKGAMGLMQLMPETARDLGVNDPWDPVQNIDAGVRYLRILLDTFNGDVNLALAAYNAGLETVMKYGGIPPLYETRRYISKVLHHWRRFSRRSTGRADLTRRD